MRKPILFALGIVVLVAVGCPPVVDVPIKEFPYSVAMTDGVLLDTRVIRPDTATPLPVLLYRTPYIKEGASFFSWAEKGYAVVLQNTRGRGASEGMDVPFITDGKAIPGLGGQRDGLDTVNWILAQDFCNGSIGGYGSSADGMTQNLLAITHPNGLHAQWIKNAGGSLHSSLFYPGGGFAQLTVVDWFNNMAYDANFWNIFVRNQTYDAMWQALDITQHQHLRDYPVVIEAGWYDLFLQGSLNNFTSLMENGGAYAREHSKLIITLSTHVQTIAGGAFPFPVDSTVVPAAYDQFLFYDRHLKGTANGYEALPRVAYYMIGDFENTASPGNEWRYADTWPVPACDTPFYFHADGAMGMTAPTEAAASVSYDYNPDTPVPTHGGANLYGEQGNYDQRSVENRGDVFTFDYGPLPAPVEITGRIWAYLYVASNCADTDFTAKLTDVYPDGRSVLLCDGIVRARYRNSLAVPEFLTPGEIYRVPIDLTSTAIAFASGHTIRVALSSSNAPRFAPNPNTGALIDPYDPVNPITATNHIYMDKAHPSHMVFPITGPDANHNAIPDVLE